MAKTKAKSGAKTADLLERVIWELNAPHRSPSAVVAGSGVKIRTVMRIKSRQTIDPRYSQVRKLANYLFNGSGG